MKAMQNNRSTFRKTIVLILLVISGILTLEGQDTISLFECRQSAMDNHPFNEQKDLYLLSKDLKTRNNSLNWYPSLDLNGKYTWQNEVVQIPFPVSVPGFETPEMPHYNYKLTLDVQQTIYDGGITRMGKELEESRYEVNRQQVEVSLNQLKEQVNGIYFYILVLQEQEKTLNLKLDVITERIRVMESALRNETILASDLSVLKAESLKVNQQLAEITISRKSALAILENLTSIELPAEPVLVLPVTQTDLAAEALRPEQQLFDLQVKNLEATIKLTERQRYPKAFVFGQFGYGNPALDFFRDEFRGYYIVGAGLHWNVWDWSKTSRIKQDLAVQQELIKTRKEAFNQNLNTQSEEKIAEILKYQEAIGRDSEILELRKEITLASASKLENGVITPVEYIAVLNAETEARLLLDLHRIQLEQSKINYLTTKGII